MSNIILIDNIKRGTGNTTICIHLYIALAEKYKTLLVHWNGALIKNFNEKRKKLKLSNIEAFNIDSDSENEIQNTLIEEQKKYDYIIVDSPKNHSYYSLYYIATKIITPIQDCWFNLNLMYQYTSNHSIQPSAYVSSIWQQKMKKFTGLGDNIKWILLLNKYTSGKSKNRDQIINELSKITKQLGMQYIKGISNRDIFKEYINTGITILDNSKLGNSIARQELFNMLNELF